jgi:RNA polymerase sigma-70 factor (ECF subfamily)
VSKPLLHKVAQGDRQAVQTCLDRYGNLVWSLARRFTQSRSDAEDAVQEVFIDLWSSAGRFDEAKASETTFVAMIARRRLIDRLRRVKREPTLEELSAAEVAASGAADEELETKSEAAHARRLLRALKPEQQTVIRLSVYHGFSHQSIADKLGIPLGTVKTHLRRGLARVRDAMRSSGVVSGRRLGDEAG